MQFKIGDMVVRKPGKKIPEWPDNEPRPVVKLRGRSLEVRDTFISGKALYIHNPSFLQLAKDTPEPESPSAASEYLKACLEVQIERGKQYNSEEGERSFKAVATAFNAITGKDLKGSDICLVQQILKDVRQYSNPTRLHSDSVLDKVSYASLHAEELTHELKEK